MTALPDTRQLLNGGWRDLAYEPFKPGITVHWIRRDDPQIAVLRYERGAAAPRHRHAGVETILVLDGSQSDDNGTYRAGDFIINSIGSEHRVWSDEGCAALLQWEKPVQFL